MPTTTQEGPRTAPSLQVCILSTLHSPSPERKYSTPEIFQANRSRTPHYPEPPSEQALLSWLLWKCRMT